MKKVERIFEIIRSKFFKPKVETFSNGPPCCIHGYKNNGKMYWAVFDHNGHYKKSFRSFSQARVEQKKWLSLYGKEE